MNGNVTIQQAVAFLNTLIGLEPIGEGALRPISPHVRTHLNAVLGYGSLPSEYVGLISDGRSQFIHPDDKAKLLQLCNYLASVSDVIRGELEK